MIKKLYINNFKCLQNFELNLENLHSASFIGKNGSGKSTIFEAIEIFQKIGQGITNLQELISTDDFSFGDTSKPIELTIEVNINEKFFKYLLILEFPETFTAPKVKEESLSMNNSNIFKREGGQTYYKKNTHFLLDWHHVGLPLLSVQSNDPVVIFKDWLKSILLLSSPYPKHFLNISKLESSKLLKDGSNIIDFARWLLSLNPSLYVQMHNYIKSKMLDLETFKFDNIGRDERTLIFEFGKFNDYNKRVFEFKQLSDGEKIFFLSATILAAQKNNPNLLCIWDEPDNFIGLREMNNFIMEFRKAFEVKGSSSQLLITSHNERVMNNFSNHNIFVINRSSHLLPSKVKVLEDIPYKSSTVIDAFENDELDI